MTSGIQSVPSTPKLSKLYSTKVLSRRTKKVLDFDGNDSYIEENDATYLEPETSVLSEDSDSLLEEITEEDLKGLDELDNSFSDDKDTLEPVKDSDEKTESDETERYSSFRSFLTKHEIPRKVLHSSIGVVTLYLYSLGVKHTQIIPFQVSLFVVIFVNDYIRFHNPEFNKRVIKFWWFIIREKEINSYNGTLWFLLGLAIVFTLYPKDISVMSVLLLSWADTAASTFGRLYGKYTPQITQGKSLAGSTAAFIAGSASCYLFYGFMIPNYGPFVDREGDIMWNSATSLLNLHLLAFMTGIFASVSEFINLFNFDDNFTIPILSSTLLFGAIKACQC